MSKRRREEDGSRPPKRARPDHSRQHQPVEEIHFPRQLQELLTFRQDGLSELRNGIGAFKSFLESIAYQTESDDRGKRLSILKEFLESQRPADIKDTDHPFLEQLWQAWSFANAEHNDALSSAISALFALLLKSLSTLLEFRELGFLLCRTALQGQHLRLVKKGLDAPRQKEFLISPCLRLLSEMVNFDGGVLAREMYKRREETFEFGMLRRNLAMVKTEGVEDEDAHRRPAVRTWTVRYILSYLKYLHEGGKAEILKQRPLTIALFSHLRDDPPDLIMELLAVTEQNVLKDENLPRYAKATLLAQQNLRHVSDIAAHSREDHPAARRAFAWLKAVATTPSYGIYRTSGWYPPGAAKGEEQASGDQVVDLGLDSLDFYDRDTVPEVRNTALLGWIQSLRPHSNEVERELALICFKAAPELVAAYFAEMKVQLEPTLSNTWIGYASFLFECIALPIPDHLGVDSSWAPLPPQTTIMVENILPRPLTQKILTRCLNQSHDLITFFAIRVLILAINKLKNILDQLAERAKAPTVRSDLWLEAADRLRTKFAETCPKIKDIIATFRAIPDDDQHALQREAITRLLRLFYEVLPLEAVEEQFDVSGALTAALIRSQSADRSSSIDKSAQVSTLRSLELEHLLQISQYSPGMRWFSKQGSLEFSPIVTLIRLHCDDVQNANVRSLIEHVLKENDVLDNSDQLLALIAAVVDVDVDSGRAVWSFLDDCLMRVVRKPVKYLDDLEELARSRKSKKGAPDSAAHACLLVAVLLEQAAFVPAKEHSEQIMQWTERFFTIIKRTDNTSEDLVEVVCSRLSDVPGWKTTKAKAKEVEKNIPKANLSQEVNGDAMSDDLEEKQDHHAHIPFSDPPIESENHPELLKWARKDLDMAFEDGDIAALMLCLCSQQSDVRIQALSQISKLMETLQNSNLDDKESIYVLIGELIETYQHHCVPRAEPLPYVAGTFATQALRVQLEPTHFMYPKINRYINKGPEWRINKLPTYWLENTVLSQPDDDDGYWKEVQWVLDWLVDGLRGSADMEIFRRAAVFEKVMTLYASPNAAVHKSVRERVLEILWRCTFIEGGSTTLITRTGVLSWLQMIMRTGETSIEAAVRRRVIETCDQDRVRSWSGLSIVEL